MKCELINRNELIAAYLSGDMTDQSMKDFEIHYFTCDECFQELSLAQDAIKVIKKEGESIFLKQSWWSKFLLKVNILKKMEEMFFIKNRYFRLAYSMALVFVIINIFGYSLFKLSINKDTEITPPASFINTLRDVSNGINQDQNVTLFLYQFSVAMSEYQLQNYNTAVQILTDLENKLGTIEESISIENKVLFGREIFFFLGMSNYLLWAKSENNYIVWMKQNLSIEEVRDSYFQDSAELYLSKAKLIVEENQLPNMDRELYYLGRVLGFSGKTKLAITELKQIDQNSSYFNRSQYLIKKWHIN